MNECDRELKDIAVQIDLARFEKPSASLSATLWRDNERVSAPLQVEAGKVRISLSPKGITALVIDGLVSKASFQDKVNATPARAGAVTHQRIQTPFGDAEAMVLSFGTELTWLYAYLTANANEVKSARVSVVLPDRTESLTDESFPFEFSLPLKAGEKALKLTFECVNGQGQSLRSSSIQLARISHTPRG
jgi:hypothetical protein